MTVDDALREQLVAIRRDLHRHPELSWNEHRTAATVCEVLEGFGLVPRSGVAGTGVIADLTGVRPGPMVAVRADLDALPVHEETGLPFASAHEGVMHACGHDAHTTMVLGAAALLGRGPRPPVPIRFIFQPAEETGAGAKAMIEAGALDGVALIFGGHVDRAYPTGTIVTHTGPVNASADTFRVEITGVGAHAARPQEGVDAILVASALIASVQSIVSREVDPAHPAVVTVATISAGTAPNVLADRATLEGTIRAQEPAVREQLVRALERRCEGVARLHGAEVRLRIEAGTPPVVNTPEMAALAREAATRVVGPEGAVPLHTTNMGGEDFGHYLERVRGCFVRFGVRAPGRETFPAHSSRFDVDEDVLPLGAAYFSAVAALAARQVAAADDR